MLEYLCDQREVKDSRWHMAQVAKIALDEPTVAFRRLPEHVIFVRKFEVVDLAARTKLVDIPCVPVKARRTGRVQLQLLGHLSDECVEDETRRRS